MTEHSENTYKNKPVFFILSRPRSGSTLLRMFFDAHPNVSIPFESPWLIGLYSGFGKRKYWKQKHILKFYRQLLKQWKFEGWDIDRDDLLNKLLSMQGEVRMSDLFRTVSMCFRSVYDKHEVLAFGDKNPSYSVNAKKLARIFPDAKFIHLVRDYRDNICSIRKFNFEAPIVSLLAYRWRYSFCRNMKFAAKNHGKMIRVKYEDIIMNPEKPLMEICKFIGIPYNSSMLDFHHKKDEFLKKYGNDAFQEYFPGLFDPVGSLEESAWKTNMSEKEQKIASAVAGKYAVTAGYGDKTYGKGFVIIKRLPVLFYGWLWYQLRYLYDALPPAIKIFLFRPGAFAGIYYSIKPGKEKTEAR
ncbi:MAG: sulfotransferase [Bacteroidota bacterium]